MHEHTPPAYVGRVTTRFQRLQHANDQRLLSAMQQPVNYPYAIEGTQVHVDGALKGQRTDYRVRFVSIESAQTWMRGVLHNERTGVLSTRKLSAYLVENVGGKVVQTLMTDLDSYEF